MTPSSNPSALYNLQLCDFCGARFLSWEELTPGSFHRVCGAHGSRSSSVSIAHTPLDVTHQLKPPVDSPPTSP